MGLLQSRQNNARLESEYRSLSRTQGELQNRYNILIDTKTRTYNYYDQTMREYRRRIDSLNQEVRRLTDINVKLTKHRNDLQAMREPDIALIRSYDKKIAELDRLMRELTQDSVGVYTTQFNTIISQNKAIEKQYDSVSDTYLHYNNKSGFYREENEFLKLIYTILFFTYYILAFVLIYIVFFKQWAWEIYYKVLFVLLFMSYPQIVYPVEQTIYNAGVYVFAIFTGTPYLNYGASKKDIMEKTTNLSTNK